LIVLSTILAILSTVEDFTRRYPDELDFLEMAFTGCFTLEILTRIWTSESYVDYFTQASNLVDIIATMPWYLEQALDRFAWLHSSNNMVKIAGSMRTLRMVRLVRTIRLLRVLRLAKAARHSETITTVFESIVDSLDGIFVLVFMVGFGSIVPATIMYACEFEEEEGKFASIPSSMWWSLATITTVGYGDVIPSTVLGKAIACGTMVIGMIIVSISVAAITTSFTESYNKRMALAKMAKSIKKAKMAAGAFAASEDLVPGNCGDSSPSLTRSSSMSFRSRERERMDLVTAFVVLEEDTKGAMMRLEQAVHEQIYSLEAREGGPMDNRPSLRTSKSAGFGPSRTDPSLIAFQVLQDQSQAFFKSAMSFVEQLSEAEAERRTAMQGDRAPLGSA